MTSSSESIIQMTTDLVRIPSRSGLDPADPILDYIERWLRDHGLSGARKLRDRSSADVVGIVCDVKGDGRGPRYVLDACVDTAPFGNEREWTHPPTAAVIEDGWLHGRGAADSKVAIAIFSHVAMALAVERRFHGTLTLLFDSDEHTGLFRGAKSFFENPANRQVAGVMIGYPGPDKVVTGSRGFLRAEVTVHGTGGHSGDLNSAVQEGNAVEKAAGIIGDLQRARGGLNQVDGFELPATISVTAIHGGEGWSTVPDTCRINVDIRLTPTFAIAKARDLLLAITADADRQRPTVRPSSVEFRESWPAYALPENSRLVTALERAGAAWGVHLRRGVVGPSNIGNYLASLDIEATAGFGVRYRSAHGTDECIELSSILRVAAIYETAIRNLLSYELTTR